MSEFNIKQFPPGKVEDNGVLRRNCLYLFSPAERAIWGAKDEIEKSGGHPLLTEAVNLLKAAQERVADYVDLCATCDGSQLVTSTIRELDSIPQDNDPEAPYKDGVTRAAKALLANWDEFGPDGGLDEYLESLRSALSNGVDHG